MLEDLDWTDIPERRETADWMECLEETDLPVLMDLRDLLDLPDQATSLLLDKRVKPVFPVCLDREETRECPDSTELLVWMDLLVPWDLLVLMDTLVLLVFLERRECRDCLASLVLMEESDLLDFLDSLVCPDLLEEDTETDSFW